MSETSGSRSRELLGRAVSVMPGGVNSPVRAWKAVGGEPPFIAKGKGAKIEDVDGRRYTDYVSSWGPLILGHAPDEVIEAVDKAARDGTSFGAPTEAEVELAEAVTRAFPSVEMLRLTSSGTEAAMSAVRVARGFTGRDKAVKFAGGYHGHADGLLVKAGSGLTTFSVPDSAGVPEGYARETVLARYNDLGSVEAVLSEAGGQVACIIVEPVAGNMGVAPPVDGFLQGLRDLSDRHGCLLIFDEVITGFRVACGGMQERSGIRADLTVLGKVLGGGLPIGAYGGRREVMEKLAPLGPVYQAGTLSGNPLATAAGLAMLRALARDGVYDALEKKAAALEAALRKAAGDASVAVTLNRVGSMMTMFFTADPVTDYDSAMKSDTALFGRWFRGMLAEGEYIAPSQFEAMFVSTAHTDDDIAATGRAAARVLEQCRG